MKIAPLIIESTNLNVKIILFFLFCVSCKENHSKEYYSKENHFKDNIEFLEVDYLPPLATFSFVYDCDGLVKNLHNKNYIIINDKKFLNQFRINFLELSPKLNDTLVRDFRVKLLYTHEKKTDTICMGIFNGIVVNGQLMNEDENFTRLVADFVNKNYIPRHLKNKK